MSSKTQGMESQHVIGNMSTGDERIQLRKVECFLTEGLFKRILRRVFPDQRKQGRQPEPPLVGYLGSARSSKPYDLADISMTGFCLLTDERWMPGTEMPVTLQCTNMPEENRDCFTVQATVVRCDTNGVGFSIVLCEEDSQAAYGNPLQVRWVTKVEMEKFLNRLNEVPGTGQTLSEEMVPTEAAGAEAKSESRLKAAFQGGRLLQS